MRSSVGCKYRHVRKCNAGLTRSGSTTKSTVYNSMKPSTLIAHANRHNFLCKIGDGENVWWQSWRGSTWTARRHRVRPNLDRESGIILWHGRILYITMSGSFIEGASWNSHPRLGGARQHGLAFPSLSAKSLHLRYQPSGAGAGHYWRS